MYNVLAKLAIKDLLGRTTWVRPCMRIAEEVGHVGARGVFLFLGFITKVGGDVR